MAVPPAEVVPRPLPAFASPAAVPLFRRTPWFVLAERLRALCSEQHVMLVELESEAALRRALHGNVVSSLLSGRNARFIQRSTFRAWALHVKCVEGRGCCCCCCCCCYTTTSTRPRNVATTRRPLLLLLLTNSPRLPGTTASGCASCASGGYGRG